METPNKNVGVRANPVWLQNIYATVDSSSDIQNAGSSHVYENTPCSINRSTLSNYEDKPAQKRISPGWMNGCLIAFLVFNFGLIVALAVSFSLVGNLQSEITAVKNDLSFKYQQQITVNRMMLSSFEKQIEEILFYTSSQVDRLDQEISEATETSSNLSLLLNSFCYSQIFSFQDNLYKAINYNSHNLSTSLTALNEDMYNLANRVNNSFQHTLNLSASSLADDMKLVHVFDCCEAQVSLLWTWKI